MFLYYDHMHHTWVFNERLDLDHPQPVAFLAHGAILPISKNNDRSFNKYGAPRSVHWIVRDKANGGSRPDGTVKVEGKRQSIFPHVYTYKDIYPSVRVVTWRLHVCLDIMVVVYICSSMLPV